MKKVVISTLMLLFSVSFVFAQSADLTLQASNMVTNTVGSFMDNPYDHYNTFKVHNMLIEEKDILNDMYTQYYRNGDYDYMKIQNMINIVEMAEGLTGEIVGNGRFHPKSIDMLTTFNQLFEGFGWEITRLCSSEDIVIYEYKKDSFKMTLAQNTRPLSTSGYEYNYVNYKCYHYDKYSKKTTWFTQHIVAGGKYQLVQFYDDCNSRYEKVTKVTSRRSDQLE